MLDLGIMMLAYLLGSIPTALIVSHVVAGADIRQLGDGNMGARNVAHVLGWWPAIAVAFVDTTKGALAVLLSRAAGFGLDLQLVASACAVLGHDFPVLAGFRGGQGFATAVGTFFALMPVETVIGLSVFGAVYLLTRRYNPSAGVGMALLFALLVVEGRPVGVLAYVALALVSVAAKKVLDLPRRRRVESHLR